MWRNRIARVVGALVLVGGVGLAMYLNFLYGLARSSECPDRLLPDITMSELAAVKERLDAYRLNPAPDAHLVLSDQEASFLLRDVLEFQVWIDTRGADVDVLLVRRDEDDACLTISFAGSLEVDDGVTMVVPDTLVIGEADLTGWTRNRRLVVPTALLSDQGKELLANIDYLTVEDDELRVRLKDRWGLW